MAKDRKRNKQTLAKKLANEFGIEIKDGKKYIDYIFSQIPFFLIEEERVAFANFGTFEIRHPKVLKKQRGIDNKIRLMKQKSRIRFKPCKKWKNLINQGLTDRIVAIWDNPAIEENPELKND